MSILKKMHIKNIQDGVRGELKFEPLTRSVNRVLTLSLWRQINAKHKFFEP